ncbi:MULTISPECIES: immunity protein Imm33 domain-containing protein [Priestia]|uniref:Immunity protein Imm33 domain-containing protein n=2 Tax=Priestia megaterium TaxID=1404 RepID=A0A806TR42_PRIMG|nr:MULTISPECIES: DUF2185 domain-containing protein [Priestia]MCL9634959.1 DUF2185 domain-containing protein [Bacillus zanthoxyli]AEN89413.1 hypothetical protein BMWSH_2531 [Priestia megaterium WSH-002]AKP77709.1 hypothetical protein AS52_02748 [Priestia megaterium Q3]MBY0073358.1 DUF2185 domain-containing protein [Priestia aryabhattai]MCM3793699.1 DUF2185 domain-containing protein [Priestia megaterium]
MKTSSGLGGSVVSNNILKNIGDLKWCIKEEPVNDLDNGWRFLSDIDTEEFLANASNMSVCDWGTIIEIEPAIINIFDMPIGTDITLLSENNKKYFVYTDSGEKVVF